MSKKIVAFKDKNKYINKFKEYKEGPAKGDVVGTLALMNAESLLTLDTDEKIEADADALIEFYHYFEKKYAGNKKLMGKIEENWFGKTPRILLIAENCIIQQRIKECEELYKNTPETGRRIIDSITDFIFGIRRERYVATYSFDDTISDYTEIPQTIFKEYLEDYRIRLRGMMTMIYRHYGTLIVAYKDKKQMKRFVLAFEADTARVITEGKLNEYIVFDDNDNCIFTVPDIPGIGKY